MNWKDLVKDVAPVLGGALGGPYGAMAAKWLSGKLVGENASPDALQKVIETADPQTFVKIKELDQQFKLEMEKLGLSREQLEVDDRKSARDLFKTNIWPQIVLSAIYVLGYFIALALVLTGTVKIDQNIQMLVNVLIGVLTASVTQIMNFWFGSSLGSKEKTSIIGQK